MEANNTRRNIELQNEPLMTIPRSSSVNAGERDATMKKLLNSASTPTHAKRPSRGTEIKLSHDRPAAHLS